MHPAGGAHAFCLGKGLSLGGWDPVLAVLERHGLRASVHAGHEDAPRDADLGILLGYRQVAPAEVVFSPRLGALLFHSSDLPRGRGWAPIYAALSRNEPLVQALLFAAAEVDSGNVIAKARYRLEGDETEAEVREIDDRLTLLLLDNALPALLAGQAKGRPQDHARATYTARRTPRDSEVTPDRTLAELFDHLRALPADAPAFFRFRGRTFSLDLRPLDPARGFDPGRLELERYYGG
jgi:methionyl-tRNA formyltransferase